MRANLEKFEEVGVDQVIFIQQGGNNRHEDICASLELFADRVMPEFKARHDARARQKAEELAPYVEQALARMPPLGDAARRRAHRVVSGDACRRLGVDISQLPGQRRMGPAVEQIKRAMDAAGGSRR